MSKGDKEMKLKKDVKERYCPYCKKKYDKNINHPCREMAEWR